MKLNIFFLFCVILGVVILGFVFFGEDFTERNTCTEDARLCPDGSSVGRNPKNNCKFFDCTTAVGTYCIPKDRNVECEEFYQPVCGWFDPEKVTCVTWPCAQTFKNNCEACKDETTSYWIEGECFKIQGD